MSDLELFFKYDKWIEKKIAGKPPNVRAFLRRTYENGETVLQELKGVSPGELSLVEFAEEKYEPLRQMFEPLAVNAAEDPDQFLHGLHQKLEEIARAIRENSLYSDFGEFLSLLFLSRVAYIYDEDEIGVRILTAYAELMMAAGCYLTPSKYDLTHLLCGCSTDGEPLYCDRAYPYAAEIWALARHDYWESRDGRKAILEASIQKHAARFGYTGLKTVGDLDSAISWNGFRTEEISGVSPYINEYTYDMIPDTAHIRDMETTPLDVMDISFDYEDIADSLNARRRTLPANGIRYDFSYSPRVPDGNRLRWLLLKEVSCGDRIVMLYKLRCGGGDLCGFYDLKDEAFFSQFMGEERVGEDADAMAGEYCRELTSTVLCTVIYLYAAAVTPDGERMIRDFGEHFRAAVSLEGKSRYPISVTPRPLGGELINTYENRGEPSDQAEEPCGDGENSQKKRTLQGYIRKLAPGEAPSEESIARAEELGFALADDEVYEEPFL